MTRFREGEILELEVAALDAEGRGTLSFEAEDRGGALASRPALVPGGFPGERHEVRIDHVSKRPGGPVGLVSRRIITPDPARRTPPCVSHADTERGRCDGCPWMTLTEPRQRALKVELLRAAHGLEVEAVHPSPADLGYRHAAKRVAFRRRAPHAGNARSTVGLDLGSFRRGSHQPASMRGCLVDHPRIREAADGVALLATELGVEAYDERERTGLLRYVWLQTNGQETLVTLVAGQSAETSLLEALAQRMTHAEGIFLDVQDQSGNALRGRGARHLYGLETISVEIAAERVEVGPLDFLQPNPAMAARMYRDLVDTGTETETETEAGSGRALDLYAGAGITTALLRRRFAEVVPCESFAPAAAKLGVAPEKSQDFLRRWREDQRGPVELVVANPPRKGLGAGVVRELRLLGAPRLHLMACGPAGLVRDLAALGASSDGDASYELESLRAYDTLPQTPHLELVAHLRRRD